MNEIKDKLHQLIDRTDDNVLLENIYQALNYQAEQNKKDILDDLSPYQLNQLNEAIGEYRRGKTKSHEEVLQMLKQWSSR